MSDNRGVNLSAITSNVIDRPRPKPAGLIDVFVHISCTHLYTALVFFFVHATSAETAFKTLLYSTNAL